MKHGYYDPEKLETLKRIDPLLYSQLQNSVSQIWSYRNLFDSKHPELTSDTAVALMDFKESMNGFAKLCDRLNSEYHSKTGRRFFNRIDHYGLYRTKLDIAISLYEDMKR